MPLSDAPLPAGLLARGPWDPGRVEVAWRRDLYEPTTAANDAADRAIATLRARGSPTHDGVAARMASFTVTDGTLALELQPARWALRLIPDRAAQAMAALCVVRAADGRWLAGHRADWLATWASRWALGAGGSVEVDENPTQTMRRELEEEWSVEPERLRVEALIRLPSEVVMLIGQAWLAEGAAVRPDHEHDGYAWWPADVADWPAEADEPLRRTAALVANSDG